ncbi:DUF3883 domain-containing protein [Megasphaera paucivorans]|uniref:Protein NO VEIN C-terminal domain-containing protein n=1 Tax=Megasphaera paucivorans TaxID=349095 RepID=A0A1G9WZR2_9FIRM|nr:DUF3883 domain-containing protein [Megasphaera paucivorans]SDM89633.1 protein of unknown function [Megasphaera paucivorans]
MLEGLKNLSFPGKKDDLIYFLRTIIGKRVLLVNDIRVLCSHAPGIYQLPVDSLISYCMSFGWILCDEYIRLNEDIYPYLESSSALNDALIKCTVCTLFKQNIFKADMFFYDIKDCNITFRNELLPLTYSTIRNVLISQNFFTTSRKILASIHVNPEFEDVISNLCKESTKTVSLEQLKNNLEANAIIGAKAEKYVLEYEKKRITNPILSKKIRIISEVDVCAGYDIVSFESNDSSDYDRFIEVKAISERNGFYWSSNEYEIAKLRGTHYYLYLIELSRINKDDYVPMILSDPASIIMLSENWLVEPQTYHVRKV